MPQQLDTASRSLKSGERDDLREIIRQGEQLSRGPVLRINVLQEWSLHACAWLWAHGQFRHGRLFGIEDEPDDEPEAREVLRRRLGQLRLALNESVPRGFSLDMTPAEAVERWMEVEAIPDEVRPRLRELHTKLWHQLQEEER